MTSVLLNSKLIEGCLWYSFQYVIGSVHKLSQCGDNHQWHAHNHTTRDWRLRSLNCNELRSYSYYAHYRAHRLFLVRNDETGSMPKAINSDQRIGSFGFAHACKYVRVVYVDVKGVHMRQSDAICCELVPNHMHTLYPYDECVHLYLASARTCVRLYVCACALGFHRRRWKCWLTHVAKTVVEISNKRYVYLLHAFIWRLTLAWLEYQCCWCYLLHRNITREHIRNLWCAARGENGTEW